MGKMNLGELLPGCGCFTPSRPVCLPQSQSYSVTVPCVSDAASAEESL